MADVMAKKNAAPTFGILGDGGMGTLCALLLARCGVDAQSAGAEPRVRPRVVLWSAFEEQAAAVNRDRENRRFLPGVALPENVTATARAADLPRDAAMIVSAVPTPYLRDVLRRVAPELPAAPVLSVSKGIENRTLARPSEILRDMLGPGRPLAVLSGPCIAFEVARGMPAAVVVAGDDAALNDRAVSALGQAHFRVYQSGDPLGVELGGALKNVIAVAAGICDGLALGVNAKAALLTRGLAEIARLGAAMGARRETFAGLAGVGDLFTTCVSEHGRNRTVGEAIGRGKSLDEAVRSMGGQVAEGVGTTRSVMALAARHGVEMPISAEVHAVLFEGKPPRHAIRDLMTRPARSEEEAL